MGQHGENWSVNALLVDLDDTCYRVPDIPELVRENIQKYMEEQLHIPAAQIPDLCMESYAKYGTTMAGLVSMGYHIDPDVWHAAVHHTLPYKQLLQREPAVKKLLEAVQLPKYLFTNADRKHAQICLELMGLEDCFDGIICFESIMQAAMDAGVSTKYDPVVCKPNPLAFELALKQAGGARAETTLFLDDSTRNIGAAHKAGLRTVLVGRTGMNVGADLEVLRLTDLPAACPALWQRLTGASNGQAPRQEAQPVENGGTVPTEWSSSPLSLGAPA